jgi:RNA polymerase sigma-70 factor (ECF subfamily)
VNNQSSRPVDWMEEIVSRNEDKLFRTAIAIMGGKADTEDIVQDVFVKLLEKQPDFKSPEHETAWLIRVAVNLCKSRLRTHWWKKTVPLLDIYPAQTDEQQSIMETILSLPSKYRAVIHLFYYEGYSTKEIAEITGQKESTVREQLTRARRMLKKYMEGEHT